MQPEPTACSMDRPPEEDFGGRVYLAAARQMGARLSADPALRHTPNLRGDIPLGGVE